MESLELRIFREVAYTKSISKAAENMGYVQSNITMHIKKLESELHTTLFLRHNKGVTLSADGEKLLLYANQIVSLLEQASSSFRKEWKQMKIGATQTIAGYLLPQCLLAYQSFFPKHVLSIVTLHQEDMEKQLVQKSLDCVITNDAHNYINAQCIFSVQEVLSLITPKICTSLSSIWEFPLVVNNIKNCPYRKIITDLFLRTSTPFKIIEVDTVASIINMVASGAGISLLPEHIVQNNHELNSFHISELEATYIKIWIHKDAIPNGFVIFKNILEKQCCASD